MELDPDIRTRIEKIVSSDHVVLFMKGRRGAPQCGFSATTTQLLDQLVPDYATVDVLQDPEIRNGIKEFSSWPTIPQLYVGGEFIGGCDIISEMFGTGELEEALGIPKAANTAPDLTITDTAAKALQEISGPSAGRELHLSIDARLQNNLYFGPIEERELSTVTNGIQIYMSAQTAVRADGLTIDAESTSSGPAFRIENPNLPKVKDIRAQEVKEKLDSGENFGLYDVRTPEEMKIAQIHGAVALDEDTRDKLEKSDKKGTIVFFCHHGGRSQSVAEHFAALGFENVFNLIGGIDSWAQDIDQSIRRY